MSNSTLSLPFTIVVKRVEYVYCQLLAEKRNVLQQKTTRQGMFVVYMLDLSTQNRRAKGIPMLQIRSVARCLIDSVILPTRSMPALSLYTA